MDVILKGDNNKALVAICNEIAATWGGHALYVDIYPIKKTVVFWCEENGEEFPVLSTFPQLLTNYGLTEQSILANCEIYD